MIISYTLTIRLTLIPIVLLTLCNHIKEAKASQRNLYLDKNARFNNFLVAINDDVAESPDLIEKIKEAYKEASSVLSIATSTVDRHKKSFAFGEIHIILPKSWSRHLSPDGEASWERMEKGNLKISKHGLGDGTPRTPQPFGCGKEGLYTIISAGHILNTSVSLLSKELVHEFAHLRWGVYDEYNRHGPHFYIRNQKILPVRCTEDIEGHFINSKTLEQCQIDPETNSLEDECIFLPSNNETDSEAGLMYATYLDSVRHFCSNSEAKSQHNSFAPNPHNKNCNRLSTQRVIAMHDDFELGPQVNPVNTRVQFKVVRERLTQNVVIVIDDSGSMSTSNRVGKVKIATKHFIDELEDGSLCSLVKFTEYARVLQRFLVVDRYTRETLKSSVDELIADGWTCMTCGIEEAMKLLGSSVSNPSAGHTGYIELLTDGQGTMEERVLSALYNTSIVVDAISITNDADNKMKEIANKTQGKDLLIIDSDTSDVYKGKMESLLDGRVFNTNRHASHPSLKWKLFASVNTSVIETLTKDTTVLVTAYFMDRQDFVIPTDTVRVTGSLYYHGNSRTISFALRDDGSGCDAEAKDGIFSAALLAETIREKTKYGVTVTATDLNTMTDYPPAYTNKFEVASVTPGSLLQKPSRITTLRAHVNLTSKVLTLTWIAVGEQRDLGTAENYAINIAENEKLLNGSRVVFTLKKNYMEAGKQMRVVLTEDDINSNNNTFYLSVVATSKHGLASDTSNLVSSTFQSLKPPKEIIFVNNRPRKTLFSETKDSFILMGLVIGLLVSIFIFVLLVGAVYSLRHVSRQKLIDRLGKKRYRKNRKSGNYYVDDVVNHKEVFDDSSEEEDLYINE